MQYAVKRKAVGIWGCKDCGKVKAGGAYTLKYVLIVYNSYDPLHLGNCSKPQVLLCLKLILPFHCGTDQLPNLTIENKIYLDH